MLGMKKRHFPFLLKRALFLITLKGGGVVNYRVVNGGKKETGGKKLNAFLETIETVSWWRFVIDRDLL
jgi:hypothetical protein